ncbi:L-glutamate gamma-semialdehyde dehydrogenase [bacterium]|nr:L-glutamate gamma-semialdehyde dehydrogenase [bacterium]
MFNAKLTVPKPSNEPVLSYAPGNPETKALRSALSELQSKPIEIPLIIGGKEVKTGKLGECRSPHKKAQLLGTYHMAGEKEVQMAVEAALEARKQWAKMPWEARVAVFLRMAELLAGPWRYTINAATMLAQSKNPFQAEIDAACELIDFFRFNAYYAMQIYEDQPNSSKGIWNYCEYRPLEGFVFAVTPFNFTSIAGNLPTAPVLMGNVSLWKPASSAVFSAYYLMKLFKAAGLPDGVINFIPGPGSKVGPNVLKNPNLTGIHFTGSTAVFQGMWRTIGENIQNYKTYPRIVGETGGKDFIFAHESADMDSLVTAAIRGAFEYQGQKCSAASRMYIPNTIWPAFRKSLLDEMATIKMGPVDDFGNFVNAVIDKHAFDNIASYIDDAKKSPDAEIIAGGGYDDSEGYFIEPTVILAKKPDFRTMVEEIFGPVLTIYIYDAKKYEESLELCDRTSQYALTGAVFAQDRNAINKAIVKLRHSAGNFYINDKPTGAVVGQQPFGGSRASGTNDKAGSKANLMRWVSTRTIKETFVPAKDYRYPFLG